MSLSASSQQQIHPSCQPENGKRGISSRPSGSPPSRHGQNRQTNSRASREAFAPTHQRHQELPRPGMPVHSSEPAKPGGKQHSAKPVPSSPVSPHRRSSLPPSTGQGRRQGSLPKNPPLHQQPMLSAGPGSWAHMLAHPEPGCLLLSRGSPDMSAFDRTVILVTSHGKMCLLT